MSDSPAIGCLAVAVFLGLGIAGSVAAYNHQETHTITVSGKDRACDGGKDGTCWYEVYGADGEVFRNEDSMFAGKWDSGTFQARFQVGHTYRVTTTGWRVPFMSMRPNIIRMSEVRRATEVPF